MPPSRSPLRARTAALAAASLTVAGLTLAAAPTAQADVSAKISTFPYNQSWSDGSLISTNDVWTGVSGVQGYRGDDLTTLTGADPQTITADGSSSPTNVLANASLTATNGGLLEIDGRAIAIQGSATADAPSLVFHLDLTGKTGTTFSFDAQDLDSTADNTNQQVAVQYRVGATGVYTNLAAGYIADATTGPSQATLVTHKDVALPASTNGSADVYVRVMTTNAPSNDELVGIDNIAITGGSTSSPLAATAPGAQTSTVGEAITPFSLQASGGTSPYQWTGTDLPPGISVASNGTVSGTPTTAGDYTPTVTVTDSAAPAATATKTFSWKVSASDAATSIADIQGTGAATPISGQTVTTEGVVTASFATGGLNGFYLQTAGPDTTPDASDGIFVYGGTSGFSSYPSVGDPVRVTGTAGEFSGATQLTASSSGVSVLGTSLGDLVLKDVIPGTDCALPGSACLTGVALDAAREKVEGEAFQPSGTFTATDVYDGRPLYNDGSNASSNFGEIGLAARSNQPLVAPTELFDAQDQGPAIANRVSYNNAHRLILDDGSSISYGLAANTGLPLPWMTAGYATRVGATVSFPAPVVLGFGFNSWRLEPTSQVVGRPSADQPQFEQTRADNLAPQPVGGDLKLATFNVLNFFPTTGEDYVSSGLGSCSYYSDRAGNRITTNSCGSPATTSGNGPRGAANDVNLVRQRDKIVAAINGSGADIVSLEELENSVKFGKDRDFAISALVDALNGAAGAGTWDFVASPPAGALPTVDQQDVIRTGFVYKPGTIIPVGASEVLADQSSDGQAFANAREPLAQAFKEKGTPNSGAFAVIVNHFKSKGSGVNDGTGQGNSNPDRVLQANALAAFADQFEADRTISRTFLVGDFNAYSHEDPIQALEDAGYTNIDSTTDPNEETYNFDGQVGSLDHVLADSDALADVNGADVWRINGDESLYYEYSRFNYNVTNLYTPTPFRSSDHSPEIVGINVADVKVPTTTTADDLTIIKKPTATVSVTVAASSGTQTPSGTVTVLNGGDVLGSGTLGADGTVDVTIDTSGLVAGSYTLTVRYAGDDDFSASAGSLTLTVRPVITPIQLLNINDFHGRIDANTTKFATTIEQLRANAGASNTLFLSAGDNIGASLFASAVQKDQPTIDVLNALGLDASAVGNHEFDQGYADLVDRVQKNADGSPNAQWPYLGANVYLKGTTTPALPEYQTVTVKGIKVGVIGVVTKETPSLVSPAGIADLDFGDPVDAVNRVAGELSDGDPSNGEADVVVAEYHEGAGSSLPDNASCAQEIAADTVFGKIARTTSADVDVIFTGHTHKTYACDGPIPGSATTRPVLQTGEYGGNIGRVQLSVDTATGGVTSYTQGNVARSTTEDLGFPRVAQVKTIVDAALANAAAVGNQPVAKITKDITTAFTGGTYGANGYGGTTTRDDRSSESTLGDLVAQALKDGVSDFATPDLGITNPGGLRDELYYAGNTTSNPANTDGVVTFAEANAVLPFNNTVAVVKLTGAQLKAVLEQQWQTNADGSTPSRPYLQLALSDNVQVTANPGNAAGSRITSVRVSGEPLDPAKTYTVSTLSFLAAGGDNFRAFTQGTYTDTGLLDAQLWRDYLADQTSANGAASPSYSRQQVFSPDLPATLVTAQEASFTLGMPATSPPVQPLNRKSLDLTSLGSPQNTEVDATLVDGSTSTSLGTFPVTNGLAPITLTVPDGTPATAVVNLTAGPSGTTVTLPVKRGKSPVTVVAEDASADFGAAASTKVEVTGGAETPTGTVQLVYHGDVIRTQALNARGRATIAAPARSLPPGPNPVQVRYLGDDQHQTGQTQITITIGKVTPKVAVSDISYPEGAARKVLVSLQQTAPFTPTGTITFSEGGTVVASGTVSGPVSSVTIPADALSAGQHTLTATYSGDGNLTMVTKAFAVTVKARTTTTAKATPGTPRVGTPVTLDVTVNATTAGTPATGDVRVSIDGTGFAVVTLADGKASVDLGSFGTAGDRVVKVEYLGTDGLLASTRSVTVKVRPAA